MELLTLPIGAITAKSDTQSRAELNEQVVADYAEFIRHGGELPPVVVFEDGSTIWLADGFHRFHAHRAAGAMEIACDVRQGSKRDAILYSVGANAAHGLRRSNEDKRRSVMKLLNDAEWSVWSANEIAKQCGVSHTFVNGIKSSLETASSEKPLEYTTKHGTTATMNTANIGKTSKSPPNPDTHQSANDGASEAGMVAGPAASVSPQAVPALPESYGDTEPLQQQIEELQAALKEAISDNEMMGRVFDADDKLKAAMDEAKRQKAIAASAERTLATKNAEFIARAQQVKYWQNRAEKAEKALKAAA